MALIAAIVVGALAAVGIFGEAPTSSSLTASEPGAAAKAAPATPVRRKIDESVTTGDLRWTVDEARRVGELRAYTLPPSTLRGDFLTVTFTVENTSDEPVTLTQDSMALAGDEGQEGHPPANLNSEYVEPEKAMLFNEEGLLDPGEEREGKVNFDLAAPFGTNPITDLSGLRLLLADEVATRGEGEYVDLGF